MRPRGRRAGRRRDLVLEREAAIDAEPVIKILVLAERRGLGVADGRLEAESAHRAVAELVLAAEAERDALGARRAKVFAAGVEDERVRVFVRVVLDRPGLAFPRETALLGAGRARAALDLRRARRGIRLRRGGEGGAEEARGRASAAVSETAANGRIEGRAPSRPARGGPREDRRKAPGAGPKSPDAGLSSCGAVGRDARSAARPVAPPSVALASGRHAQKRRSCAPRPPSFSR